MVEREVEQRTSRSFEQVRRALENHLSMEWEDVEVILETRSSKGHGSIADVIVYLYEQTLERKAGPSQNVRRAVIRWIGKPWRERENPWEKYKDRIPPSRSAGDEWSSLQPPEITKEQFE